MGLFNFMKKKKKTAPSLTPTGMPVAGAPPETQPGMPPVTTPATPQEKPSGTTPPTTPGAPPETTPPPSLDLTKEPEPNFDQMLEGLPPPPTDMPEEPPSLSTPPGASSMGQQPPAQTTGQAGSAGPPGSETEEGFDLPDFDDKDFNEFEKLKAEQVRLKAEQERAMREQEEAMRRAQEEAAKQPKPEPEPEPEPAKPPQDIRMKYLDVSKYLDIRETIDDIRNLATSTKGAVGKHSITVKSKDDKYTSLVKELNVTQDNLMFIDNKLFEGI